MTNNQRQLNARRAQLIAVRKQIGSGAYCAEDRVLLQEKAAWLERLVAKYKLAVAQGQ